MAGAWWFLSAYRAWRRESGWTARLYSLVGLGVLGTGATIGGHLAYAHGANVNRLADLSQTGEWHEGERTGAVASGEQLRCATS